MSPSLYVPVSICPRLYVSRSRKAGVSICPRLFVSPSLYVPVSICPRLYMSPSVRSPPVPGTTGAFTFSEDSVPRVPVSLCPVRVTGGQALVGIVKHCLTTAHSDHCLTTGNSDHSLSTGQSDHCLNTVTLTIA